MSTARQSSDRRPQRLSFEVKVPNATTRRAMTELEKGKGKHFDSADALFKDLGI